MSIRIWVFAVFTALILSNVGCAPAFLVRENRVKFQLEQFDDLMLSTLGLDRREVVPEKDKFGTHVFAKVLVQNTSDGLSYKLELQKAKLSIKETAFPATCESGSGETSEVKVSPGGKTVIKCKIVLNVNSLPFMTTSDQFSEFSFPYSAEGKHGEIHYAYKLKTEDFKP